MLPLLDRGVGLQAARIYPCGFTERVFFELRKRRIGSRGGRPLIQKCGCGIDFVLLLIQLAESHVGARMRRPQRCSLAQQQFCRVGTVFLPVSEAGVEDVRPEPCAIAIDIFFALGRERDGLGFLRQPRHPLAAPAREIRNDRVLAKAQLGLVEDDPSTRTVDPEAKGVDQ